MVNDFKTIIMKALKTIIVMLGVIIVGMYLYDVGYEHWYVKKLSKGSILMLSILYASCVWIGVVVWEIVEEMVKMMLS